MKRNPSNYAPAAALGLCLGLSLVLPAGAAETGITLSGGWIRSITASRPAAIYFTLNNAGGVDKQLVGASSPACEKTMLHQSKSEGGVHKMLPVKSVAVPAHGHLDFAPGGYHAMCMSPKKEAMKTGTKVPVTLSFADGGTLTAEFPVRDAMGN